jgi:hypothetical protein
MLNLCGINIEIIITILFVNIALLLVMRNIIYITMRNTLNVCECQENNTVISNKESLESPQNNLILYYTNWCGHSQNFMSDWQKIKVTLKGKVKCTEYECDKNEQICKDNGILGYPSIILQKVNGIKVKYPDDQPRTELKVIEFVNNNI